MSVRERNEEFVPNVKLIWPGLKNFTIISLTCGLEMWRGKKKRQADHLGYSTGVLSKMRCSFFKKHISRGKMARTPYLRLSGGGTIKRMALCLLPFGPPGPLWWTLAVRPHHTLICPLEELPVFSHQPLPAIHSS